MNQSAPQWLSPFVVETVPLNPEQHDTWDLYVQPPDPPAMGAAAAQRPLVVLVHGGPVPVDLTPPPRQWPVFRGYGALLAAAGAAAAVVGHPLHSMGDYPSAFKVVAAAVAAARQDGRVDADRVAVWHFSGSGPMTARWLAAPPPYLRCLAMSYPVLGDRPDRLLPEGYRPIEVIAAHAPDIPLVLTRVGRETAPVVAGVDEFIAAAHRSGATLEVIDVPDGIHGYDMDEPTRPSQDAVRAAIERVLRLVRPRTE
jgi:hypothetical protein